jgi:hypothetical protein
VLDQRIVVRAILKMEGVIRIRDAQIFIFVVRWWRHLDDAHDGGEIGGHLFEIGKGVGAVDAGAVARASTGDDVTFVDARKIRHELLVVRIGQLQARVIASELVPRIDQHLDDVLLLVEVTDGPGDLHLEVVGGQPWLTAVRLHSSLVQRVARLPARRQNRERDALLHFVNDQLAVIVDGHHVFGHTDLQQRQALFVRLITAADAQHREQREAG